jgi:hypothetical protein
MDESSQLHRLDDRPPITNEDRYAFFLEGFKLERGPFSGWIGDRGPEPIETGEEAVGAPPGAPPPLNLVS